MAATLLVEHFQPTHVLFTGIAGAVNPDLHTGDIVIGTRTTFYDYGESTPGGFRVSATVDSFTGKLNPLYFPADPYLLGLAEKAAARVRIAPVKKVEVPAGGYRSYRDG